MRRIFGAGAVVTLLLIVASSGKPFIAVYA
jgi:hypothetical protein